MPQPVAVEVPPDGDAPAVERQLKAAPACTRVSLAHSSETGQPVPQVWCHLDAVDGARFAHDSARTPSGEMTITDIPPGKFRAEVSWLASAA